MLTIIVRRLLFGIPVIFGAAVLVFFVLRVLPGDPVAVLTAGVPTTPEMIDNIRHQYGLDQPLLVQFLVFVKSIFTGFGVSYTTNQSVLSMIVSQAPSSFELALAAMALIVVVGIGLGVLSAVYRNTWVDSLIRIVSLLGTSMPMFWTAILLILFFSLRLHWFPATGDQSIQSLVLPAVALSLLSSGLVIRLVRNSIIEVLGENFVRALRARGLSPRVVILKHILRNALIPTVTIIGLETGSLMAGAVITETVFARRGLGSLLVSGILGKDYPLIQGTMLFIGIILVLVNIVVDVSYAYLDPRVRTTLTKAR